MKSANVVGNSFGATVLIRLLTDLCLFCCLFCYLLSQLGAADDGLDRSVGSRGRQVPWHVVWYQFVMESVNIFGNSVVTLLVIRLCRISCLVCYPVSQRGIADDGFDNGVGSRLAPGC